LKHRKFSLCMRELEGIDIIRQSQGGRMVFGLRQTSMIAENDAECNMVQTGSHEWPEDKAAKKDRALYLSMLTESSLKSQLKRTHSALAEAESKACGSSESDFDNAEHNMRQFVAAQGPKRQRFLLPSDKFFDMEAVLPAASAKQWLLQTAGKCAVPDRLAQERVEILLSSVGADDHTKVITFIPGTLGLSVTSAGIVKQVTGQAKQMGVKVGWEIVGLSAEKVNTLKNGSRNYAMEFNKGCSGVSKSEFDSMIASVYQLSQTCKVGSSSSD